MATTTKTINFTATFAIKDAAGTASPNKVIKDTDLTVTQVQTSDPMTIAAATANFSVPFGQITVARRIFLSTDQEVTLKIGLVGETGFAWHGAGIIPLGTTGVPALFITTGGTATNVEVVIAGE